MRSAAVRHPPPVRIKWMVGLGVVRELTFVRCVLLQPEHINAYAQAVICALL